MTTDPGVQETSGRLMEIELGPDGSPVYLIETREGVRLRVVLPGLPRDLQQSPRWPPPLERKVDPLTGQFPPP